MTGNYKLMLAEIRRRIRGAEGMKHFNCMWYSGKVSGLKVALRIVKNLSGAEPRRSLGKGNK